MASAPGALLTLQALRDELRLFAHAELRTQVRAVVSEAWDEHFGLQEIGLERSADRLQLTGSSGFGGGCFSEKNAVEYSQPVPLPLDVQQLCTRLLCLVRQELRRFERGLGAAAAADAPGNSDVCEVAAAGLPARASQDHMRPISPYIAPAFVRYGGGGRRRAPGTKAPAYRQMARPASSPRPVSSPMRVVAAWHEAPPMLGPVSRNSGGDKDESDEAIDQSSRGVVRKSGPTQAPAQDPLVLVDVDGPGPIDDSFGGENVGGKARGRKSVGFLDGSADIVEVAPSSVLSADVDVAPSSVLAPLEGDVAAPRRPGRGATGKLVVKEMQDFSSRISNRVSKIPRDSCSSRASLAPVSTQTMVGLHAQDLKHTRWGKKIVRENVTVQSRAHAVITRIVVSNVFDYMMCVVLVANAVIIGGQVEHAARHPAEDLPGFYRTCEQVFCVIFTLEVAARVYVFRTKFFVTVDWSWNLFDSFSVALALFEEIMVVASGGNGATGEMSRNVKQVKMLRFLRLLRAIRVLRIVRFVQELSNIIYLIVGSLWSFIWTFVLLMLLTYISATFVTQVVADHVADENSDPVQVAAMSMFWGSIGDSVLSLFQGITGGVDWKEIVEPLVVVNPALPWVFAFYIGFAALVMLNLVTGVFVESAQSLSQQDKKLELIRKLRMVLDIAGIREGGYITWSEFEEQLGHPELIAFFDAINIDRVEAETVFQLLDSSGEGRITAEEFVLGGLRLQGPAKAIDLARTQLSVDLAREQMAQVEAYVLDLKDPSPEAGERQSVRRASRAYVSQLGGQPTGRTAFDGNVHIPAYLLPGACRIASLAAQRE